MWTIGLDPGLTETGLVLLNPEGHYVTGVTFRAAKEGADLERIGNLADAIVGAIRTWFFDYQIHGALVAIETPILRGGGPGYNVVTYRKQVSLLHEIERQLWAWAMRSERIRIAEINPMASKRAATGSGAATKDDMVAASPFSGRDDIPRPSREALSDAWGHALAARLVTGVTRYVDLADLECRALPAQWRETRVLKLEVD